MYAIFIKGETMATTFLRIIIYFQKRIELSQNSWNEESSESKMKELNITQGKFNNLNKSFHAVAGNENFICTTEHQITIFT
jgi:hypothetical protein